MEKQSLTFTGNKDNSYVEIAVELDKSTANRILKD